MIDISELPKIPIEGIITNEAGKRLLQWVELFKKLGVSTIKLEEDSDGDVEASNGVAMCILFEAFPVKSMDTPYGEAYFNLNKTAEVSIVPVNFSIEEFIKNSKIKEKSPISSKTFKGTWEDVYHKIAEYMQFREKMIPQIPKDLLEQVS